jgi:hypothetical protein
MRVAGREEPSPQPSPAVAGEGATATVALLLLVQLRSSTWGLSRLVLGARALSSSSKKHIKP